MPALLMFFVFPITKAMCWRRAAKIYNIIWNKLAFQMAFYYVKVFYRENSGHDGQNYCSEKPSHVGMDFERPIDFVASCDKVSQKSLAKLARLLQQLPLKLSGSERGNSSHDGTNFLGGNFVPSWDEVEKSRQLDETFRGGGVANLWPSWPQVEKWCSS